MQQGAGTSCFPPIHFLATQELPLPAIRPLSIMAGGQRDPVMCLTFPLRGRQRDSDSYLACFCHISCFKCPRADGNQSPHSWI